MNVFKFYGHQSNEQKLIFYYEFDASYYSSHIYIHTYIHILLHEIRGSSIKSNTSKTLEY